MSYKFGPTAHYLEKILGLDEVQNYNATLLHKVRVWTESSCFERDVYLLKLETPEGVYTAKFCRGARPIAGTDLRRVFYDFKKEEVEIKDPNSGGESPWNYGFHDFEELEAL